MDNRRNTRGRSGHRTSGNPNRRKNAEYRPSRAAYERRRAAQRAARVQAIIAAAVLVLLVVVLVVGFSKLSKSDSDKIKQTLPQVSTVHVAEEVKKLKEEAQVLAKEYKYDEAIDKLNQAMQYDPKDEEAPKLLVTYQTEQSKLVEYSGSVEHVFFHQLIVDPSITFDEKNKSDWLNFNSVMTTVDEFKKMMQSMYDKGYILIRFSDIFDVKKKDDGTTELVQKTLMLPKGKKPFILSEDDTNFYEKTTLTVGGLGRKFVLDENGKPKVEYVDKDGNTQVGDYDVVPILDTFIEEHPDFSYRGAKGYIGLTGYNGALGYRINEIHNDQQTQSKDLEADREMVKKIAKACRDDGWEFASHSYAHGHQSDQDLKELKSDLTNWKNEIEKYIGDTDVYLFPYGDWGQNGTKSDEQLKLIASYGFHFLNGVGLKTFNGYKAGCYFMDRANLDGTAMTNHADYLKKFFDVSQVWDNGRPDNSMLKN